MPKKPRKKRMTKTDRIVNTPIEQIMKEAGKGGMSTLQSYLRTLRIGYGRRVSQIKRAGLYSHAQYVYENSAPRRKTPLKKLTRNQLIAEIARLQHFFKSKTATVEGIREVNNKRNKTIFGIDEEGWAKFEFDIETERRFWTLYNEYNNLYPYGKYFYGSEKVQQILGDIVYNSRDLNEDDFELYFLDMIIEAEERLSKEQAANPRRKGFGPNVYSGKGNPFNK